MADTFLHVDLRGKPRSAPFYRLVDALSDEQAAALDALKRKDWMRLTTRGDDAIPETSSPLKRAATKAGISVSDWMDAAGVPKALPAA